RSEVKAAVFDHLHQPPHSFFSAGTQRCDNTVVADARGEGVIGDLELSGIHAKAGKSAARPQAAQAILKGLLQPESFNSNIDAAGRQPLYLSYSVHVAIVEYNIGAHPLCHSETVLVRVDANNQRRAH